MKPHAPAPLRGLAFAPQPWRTDARGCAARGAAFAALHGREDRQFHATNKDWMQ